MKNKYLIYFITMLIFTSIFLGSCKKKEEPKNEEDRKPPQSLEQVQELTEEIVKKTIEKDWGVSTEKTKELHSKWNEFYPDAQKKGLAKEKSDEFNADLNRLTDLLISKVLNLPKQTIDEKTDDKKKEEEDKGQKEEEGQEKSKEGSEEKEQSKEGSEEKEQGEEGSEDKEQSKEGSEDKEQSEEGNEEVKDKEEDKKDPKEVVKKEVPLIITNAEDLIIINASIELTKHIPIFMSLFESEVPPDVMKLKYLVRHIDVSTKLQKWNIATQDIEKALEIWVYIQPKVIEVKDSLAIQVQQSLTELVEVVELKDSTLTTIKSDIVIKNIEKIGEEFKKKAEKDEKK